MLEKIKNTDNWKETFEAVVTANREFTQDHTNEEKLEKFKTAWNKAFLEATTTEQEEELDRHYPIDHVGHIHSEAKKKLIEKWGKLDEEEELSAGSDPIKLKHAYDHAPSDGHRKIALDALISVITEKDAKRFHQDAGIGTDIALALEKKFSKLFAEKKDTKVKNRDTENGGLNDTEDFESEDDEEDPYSENEEKKAGLIDRLRKRLGL